MQASQRLAGRLPIALARHGEQAEMRGPAHQHGVEHAKREEADMRLGHVGEGLRPPLARPAGEVLAIDRHPPALRREQAEDGLEQGGLAAAVWAEQADDLALAQAEAGIAPDRLAAIAEGQILDLEAHRQPSRPRARSHRKNGAPRKAVRMPSGTSVTAMVRASVSTIRR